MIKVFQYDSRAGLVRVFLPDEELQPAVPAIVGLFLFR